MTEERMQDLKLVGLLPRDKVFICVERESDDDTVEFIPFKFRLECPHGVFESRVQVVFDVDRVLR